MASGGFGGGIDVTCFPAPLIQNNIISGNSAYNYGGGINVSSYDKALVVQNIITNTAQAGVEAAAESRLLVVGARCF